MPSPQRGERGRRVGVVGILVLMQMTGMSDQKRSRGGELGLMQIGAAVRAL